ncbi:glmZ(sRNA)-inactivating NTPase [Fervidicella metallireducens AeB]|uniref:GlmZ(SRNA)-inactivating NTPase n=1 Tax=Fervidicella metallireducens AeB TaxID=1403537 RepID=A0A017RVJ6_9CLOT|nr:RNase adapter RapZ [Fervidicella metallireducens]EYE88601.1 glmZ(sRNA)-inactivating NTPase [Fervidicella metallireducens AeB]
MKFVIVTGLSGAGKTQAIRCLEDIGYFCIDNLPPALIPKFAEVTMQTDGKIQKIALVVDIRGGKFFNDLFKSLKILSGMGYSYEILFLDASDDVLVKRYKESRRNHPLANNGRIINGILEERKKLSEVKEKADHIIDTSNLSTRQLKAEIQRIYASDGTTDNIVITVMSFGFKYGIPIDADLVFDVRFLPNPYYVEELKKHSGNEQPVKEYVLKWPESNEFITRIKDLMDFLIPNYIKEGKSQLVIAIGCTGGRHRSVVMANLVYEHLKDKGHTVIISHRDISQDVIGDGK